MADRPAEQRFLRGEIGRDGLADIEAVDEEGAVFVGAGRQRPGSRLESAQNALRVPADRRRQG